MNLMPDIKADGLNEMTQETWLIAALLDQA